MDDRPTGPDPVAIEDTTEDVTGPEASDHVSTSGQDGTKQDAEVARAVAMETTPSDDVSLYQLKWIEWKSDFVPIVTQNDNGPCPLLALCNVLLLNGRMKLPAGETVVTSTHLTDLLGTYLLELRPKDLPEAESANYEQNITDAMAIFPKLQTGLDVNVKFNSVAGFEFTCESGLFDLLGVPLYHGWLVDPQDHTSYDVIAPLSFNQLVEMVINDSTSSDADALARALSGQQFLEFTASQLTYHGLCELGSVLRAGELAVFFRNNHFSTLYKRKDQLLLLVTDHGFVGEASHVWETLEDIDGGGDFLDARFRPSGHSHTQQQRVGGAGSKVGAKEEEEEEEGEAPLEGGVPVVSTADGPSTAATTDVDYETALNMQRNEYLTPNTALDEQLALQLQQVEQPRPPPERPHPPSPARGNPPPNSREEYERQAVLDRQQQKRGGECVTL